VDVYTFLGFVVLAFIVLRQNAKLRRDVALNRVLLTKTVEALNSVTSAWNEAQTQKQKRAPTPRPQRARPQTCWEILGVRKGASEFEINRAWRDLAKSAHPDVGGTYEQMLRLNTAREEALRQKGTAA
jgi:hypothetical protein